MRKRFWKDLDGDFDWVGLVWVVAWTVVFALVLLSLDSCSVRREVSERVVERRDTVYLSKVDVRFDSVWVDRWRDVYVSGDTVHEVRTETRYKWRLWTVRDTVWKWHDGDSVAVEERVVEKVVSGRSGYDRFCSWGFWILVVLVVGYVVVRVVVKLTIDK